MAFDFTAIFGNAESMTKEQLETADRKSVV